jgi:hypothetical protein
VEVRGENETARHCSWIQVPVLLFLYASLDWLVPVPTWPMSFAIVYQLFLSRTGYRYRNRNVLIHTGTGMFTLTDLCWNKVPVPYGLMCRDTGTLYVDSFTAVGLGQTGLTISEKLYL